MTVGKLTEASATATYQLGLRWDDGFSANVDLSRIISARAVLGPLRMPGEFDKVEISSDGWSLEWPCGIDLGAMQLRRWARCGQEDQRAA